MPLNRDRQISENVQTRGAVKRHSAPAGRGMTLTLSGGVLPLGGWGGDVCPQTSGCVDVSIAGTLWDFQESFAPQRVLWRCWCAMDFGRRFVTLVFTQPDGSEIRPCPGAPAGRQCSRTNPGQPAWAIEATPSAFRYLRFASQMSKP